MRSNTRCCACQASSVMPLRCFRSPPAQNAFSPWPVRITARRPSMSVEKPSNSSTRSRPICVFIALDASGRCSVTSRISPSRRSTLMVWNSLRIVRPLACGCLERSIVLAQRRRGCACVGTRAVKGEWDADDFDIVVRAAHHHIERAGLRMRRHPIGREQRRAWNAGSIENFAQGIRGMAAATSTHREIADTAREAGAISDADRRAASSMIPAANS